MTIQEKLGNALRRLRNRQGLSQEAVALAAHIDRRYMSDVENGKRNVSLDILDVSGRLLWNHTESGVSTNGAYTIDWDLTIDGGQKLQTGVYLYRVRVACDGSKMASKAKKLIIIDNN